METLHGTELTGMFIVHFCKTKFPIYKDAFYNLAETADAVPDLVDVPEDDLEARQLDHDEQPQAAEFHDEQLLAVEVDVERLQAVEVDADHLMPI